MSDAFDARLEALLASLERMAGGDLDHRIEISAGHDAVDAIAHAVNVLVGELQLVTDGLRRAKEEAEAASAAKTVFLRNASHEIRTPLTVILGLSELIASRRVPDERVEGYYQRVVTNGRTLTRILDDLLDLSKVEAQRLELELQALEVAQVTAEIVAQFEVQAERKALRLVTENLDPSLIAIADVHRLRQILTNLVGNAIKFTEQGSITVRLGRARAMILLDVADTGIGLTTDQAGALFQPFAQADRTIPQRFGGTGLGLALSQRLAEAMGGGLELLESREAAGSTFRLSLPAAPADVTPEVATSAARLPRYSGSELEDRTILVVEDNDDVRATTSAILRDVGATVVEATNGQQAIERWNETPVDVILMDVRMPVLDGIEATRRLRAAGVAVPIIALTADALADEVTSCLAAGCTAHLAKPLDVARLVEAVTAGAARE